jgi:hypothetical protein
MPSERDPEHHGERAAGARPGEHAGLPPRPARDQDRRRVDREGVA